MMANEFESRLDRVERLLVNTAEQGLRNAESIEHLAEIQRQSLEMGQLDREKFQAFRNRTEQTLLSINAALERIDRVLDYLIKRDSDRST